MAGISYLFPPDKINGLPTWRFIVHFTSPEGGPEGDLGQAVSGLKSAQWKIVQFPVAFETLKVNQKSGAVSVPVEISPERRKGPTSLQEYESDFWKICGHMAGAGFKGEIYYEAVDWKE